MMFKLFFLCSIFLIFSVTYGKQEVEKKDGTPSVHSSLEIYSNCLKKLTSVEAKFRQKRGTHYSGGKLYLQKPGKLRIIYDPSRSGQRREILSDGEYLTEYVFDNQGELSESSSIALQDTPLEVVLNTKGIDLKFMDVQRITSNKTPNGTYTSIHIIKKGEPNSGKVVLIFKEHKNQDPQFCGWVIYDEHQQEISLELQEVNSNVIILPNTFSTTSQTHS